MTLRAAKAEQLCTFIDATKWGPADGENHLVDGDWLAIGQAINWGVEGAEVKNLYYKFVEMNKEVNFCSPGGSSRANVL